MGWKGHEWKQNCQLEGFGHHEKLQFAFEGWEAVNKPRIYTRGRIIRLVMGMDVGRDGSDKESPRFVAGVNTIY